MVIIAWIIFYFFASFLPETPAWGICTNTFNTDSKYHYHIYGSTIWIMAVHEHEVISELVLAHHGRPHHKRCPRNGFAIAHQQIDNLAEQSWYDFKMKCRCNDVDANSKWGSMELDNR